ncbi:hypothetical protein [Noviherbaspirillum malthae]|uniref:hypothetical protein n=1 Tax=Noviherbaspirillum malthae TaxID=1260987 RepID=UPI001E5F1E17|nr:hypothetical protein [Noviherbaspirillum malthae]
MNKKMIGRVVTACLAATVIVPSAHAQFLGVFQGVINAANQVTGKLGNRIMGGENAVNLEDERTKFNRSVESQLAGMDDATKRILQPKLEASWAMAEQGFLMRNAQAYRSKLGPLIDFKQVATSALGGVALQANMGGALLGNNGLGEVLSGATMNGILTGVGAQSTGFDATGARMAASAMGSTAAGTIPNIQGNVAAAVTATATSAVTTAVSGAVSSTTQQILRDSQLSASSKTYEINELNHPLNFFEKHPSELVKGDLYRENGNIGWKKIEGSSTAEAYAPVAGDDVATASVFNFDPTSQKITAAFRILKATQMDFIPVVQGISKALQAQPRYASQGSVLRAVWENGAFVTADTAKLTAGWSLLVPQTYRAAVALPQQATAEVQK